MTITPETIENLEDDCIHIAEVAVGKEGGSAVGAPIDTSTDRLGQVKKTLPKILEEMQDTTVSVLQLKNDLTNTTDPVKGAGMVGYKGRTQADKNDDSLSVDDYGVDNTGATDSTGEFQAMMDALPTDGRPITIRFSHGRTYKMGSTPIRVQRSNVTFDFNNCTLINAGDYYETVFEVYPVSLNARKALTDYPPAWYVGANPYPFDSDWRTMMHEHVEANRLKNITIKNCFTDTNFEGILFQVFSTDGVTLYNNNMQPGLHAAIRCHHSRNIKYYNNTFGGTGVYGLFFYKCAGIEMEQNDFQKDKLMQYSIKGVFHGIGRSIFDSCTPGFTDVGIKISNNNHFIKNANVITPAYPQYGRIDAGGGDATINEDAVGYGGGTPIGFTRLEWVGPGAKNITVTHNKYDKDSPVKTSIFGVFLPAQDVNISHNEAKYGCIFVAGGERVTINKNTFTYDPSAVSDDIAPIALRADSFITTQGEPNTGEIKGNIIRGMASTLGGEDNTAILLRGSSFDISDNRIEFPGAGVVNMVKIDSATSNYNTGEGNLVLTDANAIDLEKTRLTKVFSGANANGGTVFCSLVDTVTGKQTAYKYGDFSSGVYPAGLTTTGTVTVGPVGATYTLLNGLCFFNIRLTWSELTGTGDLVIKGLPFKADNGIYGGFQYMLNIESAGLSHTGVLKAYVGPGEDQIRFDQQPEGGNPSAVQCDPAATVFISGFYPYMVE